MSARWRLAVADRPIAGWHVVHPFGKADYLQSFAWRAHFVPKFSRPRYNIGNSDVLERRRARQQVESLEHEADFAISDIGQLIA